LIQLGAFGSAVSYNRCNCCLVFAVACGLWLFSFIAIVRKADAMVQEGWFFALLGLMGEEERR
jgi:hypothetical protein